MDPGSAADLEAELSSTAPQGAVLVFEYTDSGDGDGTVIVTDHTER